MCYSQTDSQLWALNAPHIKTGAVPQWQGVLVNYDVPTLYKLTLPRSNIIDCSLWELWLHALAINIKRSTHRRRFAIHCVQDDPEKLQLSSLLLRRDPQYAGLKSGLKKNRPGMLPSYYVSCEIKSSCKIYILWVICTNVFYALS